MKPKSYAILYFLGSIMLALGLFYLSPKFAASPGPLMQGHTSVSDCQKCHTVFKNDYESSCISCHAITKIGFFKTTGEKIPRNTKSGKVNHQRMGPVSCGHCHVDHRGVKLAPNLTAFNHENESYENGQKKKKCQTCHSNPPDTPHKKNTTDCDVCHSTKIWNKPNFDHSVKKVPENVFIRCESCHKSSKDSFHKSKRENCGDCHKNDVWKPIVFDHAKYYRLDKRHKGTCKNCHKLGVYTQYKCTGCHAHSKKP
ncbi:MAG: cytochrome c3 family protein [Leptospirales bacterium]